jgi:hypothetical protein
MRFLKVLGRFLLLLLLSYQVGYSQTDYVVTTKGDTIKGKLKYLNSGFEKKVQVTTPDGKKNFYVVTQTIEFKLGSDRYYPVRLNEIYTYMKLIKQGYLGLYSFQQPNQITWDGRYLLKKDGNGIEVPNLGFKKILNKFLSECPHVTARIESGELPKSKLNDIIDEYNSCIDSNTVKQLAAEDASKVNSWNILESEVRALDNFEQKTNALEMIAEIKSKIKKGERIPNFLTEGLRDSLKDQPTIKDALEKTLAEIKN